MRQKPLIVEYFKDAFSGGPARFASEPRFVRRDVFGRLRRPSSEREVVIECAGRHFAGEILRAGVVKEKDRQKIEMTVRFRVLGLFLRGGLMNAALTRGGEAAKLKGDK